MEYFGRYSLQEINTGVDLGVDRITIDLAYFLGGICVGDKVSINGRDYFIALVRHNPGQVLPSDLELHLNSVKTIAESLNKSNLVYMHDYFRDNNISLKSVYNNAKIFGQGKVGFVTLFEVTDELYDLSTFIQDIREALLSSNEDVLRAFIIGAFDCKGAYDKSSLIALDYKNAEVACLLRDVLNRFNIAVNLNDGALARMRDNPDAEPRAAQFRVNYITYMEQFGYISGYKYMHTLSKLDEYQYDEYDDNLLNNLKSIDFKGV